MGDEELYLASRLVGGRGEQPVESGSAVDDVAGSVTTLSENGAGASGGENCVETDTVGSASTRVATSFFGERWAMKSSISPRDLWVAAASSPSRVVRRSMMSLDQSRHCQRMALALVEAK